MIDTNGQKLALSDVEPLLHAATKRSVVQGAALNALVRLPLEGKVWGVVAEQVVGMLKSRTVKPVILEAAARVPVREVRSELQAILTRRIIRRPADERLVYARVAALVGLGDGAIAVWKSVSTEQPGDLRLLVALAVAHDGFEGPLRVVCDELVTHGIEDLELAPGEELGEIIPVRGAELVVPLASTASQFLERFVSSHAERVPWILTSLVEEHRKVTARRDELRVQEDIPKQSPAPSPAQPNLTRRRRAAERAIEQMISSDVVPPAWEFNTWDKLLKAFELAGVNAATGFVTWALSGEPPDVSLFEEVTELIAEKAEFKPDVIGMFELYCLRMQPPPKHRISPDYAAAFQVAWVASRAPLERVISELAPVIQGAASARSMFAVRFLTDAIKYASEREAPMFGGGAAPYDVPFEGEIDPDVAFPVREEGGGEEAAPGVVEPTDSRRLQALVRHRPMGSGKMVVADRFVAGAEHDIRICIAADQRQGAVVADAPFKHPAPGEEVALDVSIIVSGHRAKRRLRLPVTGDTKWTVAVPFRVPNRTKGFEVHVEVAYQRRVIQSAMLCGAPLVLSIDQSAPLSKLEDRDAAHGIITLVDGPRGNPAVIDLDRDAGDVDAQQVKIATRSLRKELFAAFTSPPSDLAHAAGSLTKLAVRGRTLYQRLASGSNRYHETDSWIHINAFTTRDVPIELAYDHPMPDDDDEVPICDEALAGATSCSISCPSRARDDVVCPFGFWATSKIIERRSHVSGRRSAVPATQRRVNPIESSVVGVSVKANEVDATASGRIVAALAAVVATSAVATSWTDLEQVVTSHPTLVVLVTHTIASEDGDDLDTALELNGDVKPIHRIGEGTVNPGGREPGPVVLALGCDTNVLTAGFTDLVVNLHAAQAEIVVSSLSPIPGKGVADFLERFMPVLRTHIQAAGTHRFGAAMLAARQATMATGDLMALALTTSGDGDVELVS